MLQHVVISAENSAAVIEYSDAGDDSVEEDEDEVQPQQPEQPADESFSVDEDTLSDCGSIDLDCTAIRQVKEAAEALERTSPTLRQPSRPSMELPNNQRPSPRPQLLSTLQTQHPQQPIPAARFPSVAQPFDKAPERTSATSYVQWSFRSGQSAPGAAPPAAGPSFEPTPLVLRPTCAATPSSYERTSAPSLKAPGPPVLNIPPPQRLPSMSGHQSPSVLPSSGGMSPIYNTKLAPLSSRNSPSVTSSTGFDPADLHGARKLDMHCTATAQQQRTSLDSWPSVATTSQPFVLSAAGLVPAAGPAAGKLPAMSGRPSLPRAAQSGSPERMFRPDLATQAKEGRFSQLSPAGPSPDRLPRNVTPQGRQNRALLLPSLEAQRAVQAVPPPQQNVPKSRKLTVSESIKGVSGAEKPSYTQWSFRHRSTDNGG